MGTVEFSPVVNCYPKPVLLKSKYNEYKEPLWRSQHDLYMQCAVIHIGRYMCDVYAKMHTCTQVQCKNMYLSEISDGVKNINTYEDSTNACTIEFPDDN